MRMPSRDGGKEGIIMAIEKFCTRCGKKFLAVGREVICPACKEQAAEATKKAAVLKAKMASWTGESVPVRISGRASTVIRAYGAENNMPFAAALDALLQASAFFQSTGKAWEDITPYRSHRRDKAAADKQAAEFLHNKQDAPQDVTSKPQDVQAAKKAVKATSTTETTQGRQEVKQEAPQASKPQEVRAAKTTSKNKASKAAGRGGKA